MVFFFLFFSLFVATTFGGTPLVAPAEAHPTLGMASGALADAFLCDAVRTTPGATRFTPREVSLSHDWQTGGFRVFRPVNLCHTVALQGSAPESPDSLFVGYALQPVPNKPPHPLRVKHAQVHVEDALGEVVVDLRDPVQLLTPSLRGLTSTAVSLGRAPLTDDPSKCYAVQNNTGAPPFTQTTVVLTDQFETRRYTVKRPTQLCTSVSVNNGGQQNPEDALLCYSIQLAKEEASHRQDRGLLIRNQFGETQVDGVRAEELCIPALVKAGPVFTDVTTEAGVAYLQHAAQEEPNCIFPSCESERMAGGAAVGDVDNDGDPDLYVSRLDAPGILFLNRGNGTFKDGTKAANLANFNIQGNGAAFGDIDNDGDLDLYVTTLGYLGDEINSRNYLFINQGNGTFIEEAESRGAAVAGVPRRIYSATFGDYDKDGWLDLHMTEWNPIGTSHARLLHNRGAAAPGVFEDVTGSAGVTINSVFGFASAFSDLDGDSWPDLAIAGDFGTSQLFWNNGDGAFSNGTVAAHVGTDENGMGSTIGDFDGDGKLDWFVTSIYDPDRTCDIAGCNWGYTGNRLYRNQGGRLFTDATDSAGVRQGGWGWGAAFFDYDNDSDLDLTMTNGVNFPGMSPDAAFNSDPVRLWNNDSGGVMTEKATAASITDTGSGKGLLVFDYDNDGDLDLFIVNNADAPKLYRNDGGNAKSWLRVKTIGTVSNREGIGAKVTVQVAANGPTQMREVNSSGFFLSQSERIAHFGLGVGGAPIASVKVEWPSGQVQMFTDVARNSILVATEPVSP